MDTIWSIFQKQCEIQPDHATAIHWVDSRLQVSPIDWGSLKNEISRRATFLQQQGCKKGDRVFIFLEHSPEIWYFFWGALQCGAIPCVLFPDFGADALSARLTVGQATFLITDHFPSKHADVIAAADSLRKLICVGQGKAPDSFVKPIAGFDPESENPATLFLDVSIEPDDGALMVFTSGSTGFPKAVLHNHSIGGAVLRSMRDVLGLKDDDLFWCTANPAWITGTIYGVIGPLISGVASVQYAGNFHAKRWIPILQNLRITVWYSAPTAFRSLMNTSDDFYQRHDFSALRSIFCVGEPLNPTVFEWGRRTFSQPIYDTWFQTEAGTIRIANRPGDDILPGYMGKAVDDAQPIILDELDHPCNLGETGRLCLKSGWQSCFSAYYGNESAYNSKFQKGYYQTGDLAFQDEAGRFCFVGRDDDVINTSGHLVGPFEVESVLLELPEITEAGVVAAPDPLLFEKVVAFIALRDGVPFDNELETRLRVAVTTRLSSHATPKAFFVLDSLPKNAAGKILRNELRKLVRDDSV